jgi:tetratricopeptide (TPR) repeat protein
LSLLSTCWWLVFEQQGRYREAAAALEQARDSSAGNAARLAGLGHVLTVSGRREGASEILTKLTDSFRGRYLSPYWPALMHAGLGEKSKALDWLEQALELHDVWLVWLGTDPRLDILRAEVRFEHLLRQVGLAPRFGSARSGG